MPAPNTPRRSEIDLRSGTLLFLAVMALLVLFFRLWYVQVVKADELKRRANTLTWRMAPLQAPRGPIVDRNNEILAGSRSELVISIVPALAEKDPYTLNWLADILQQPVESIKAEVQENRWKRYLPTPVMVGASIDLASQIAEAALSMPAVRVDSQPMRVYGDTRSFSHLLGYVWTPSADDMARLKKEGIKPNEYVGKTGVEWKYEKALMGNNGVERFEIDKRGQPVRLMERKAPEPGAKLVLTIDSELQRTANELLDGRVGAIVAIEPTSGEVLAMSSSPGFDTQPFLTGISSDDYADLSNDTDKPFLNRATSGIYAPGSTFKVITTLAAAAAGKFDPERTVTCRGYYEIAERKLKCLGVHGAISYRNALTRSCNAYFSDLAMRAGIANLRTTALNAGLGNKTGIDLPAENKGVVPTTEWMKANLPAGTRWYDGDTVNLGIGQGRVAATPLQMACLMSLVANRGYAFRPHLVRQEVYADGRIEAIPRQIFASIEAPSDVWDLLQDALVQVIERGTARSAQIGGVTWAGKTGSTEHRRDQETHSWFVGYAPAERPRIAIAVLVEKAGHGGEVAAPIAAQVVERYLRGES